MATLNFVRRHYPPYYSGEVQAIETIGRDIIFAQGL